MGVAISYMGTKRQLACSVAEVAQVAQPGIFFDAFSGMCAVGQEIGPARQIWTNDVQVFASQVGAALFTSQEDHVDHIQAAELLYDDFHAHRKRLRARFRDSLRAETQTLESKTFSSFMHHHRQLKKNLAADTPKFPRKCGNFFAVRYSNTYIGVRQAIELDAIVTALNASYRARRTSREELRWLRIALGKTLLKISTSPGHFAQYLKPKENSYRTHIRQRSRRVWSEWLSHAGELSAIGKAEWRQGNRAFNTDSLRLLKRLKNQDVPSVVYADPPYTDDQYSRFYHLLETLLLYDYPRTTGAGLCRDSRYVAPFSHKSRAADAISTLISATAKLGADLVLSYPTNGLLYECGITPEDLLKKHFQRVEITHALSHSHSTFGASKGPAQSPVTEQIYLARL